MIFIQVTKGPDITSPTTEKSSKHPLADPYQAPITFDDPLKAPITCLQLASQSMSPDGWPTTVKRAGQTGVEVNTENRQGQDVGGF